MGAAVISEHLETLGIDVKDVWPWIMRDVEKYQECLPDALLAEFLYDCRDPNISIDKASLYKECLAAVLPICNGEYRRKKIDPVDSSEIKAALKEYIKPQHETSRYAPFVRAVNCALRCLGDLAPRGLIRAMDWDDDRNILFHRSDPVEIRQTHQGRVSRRKPDVVVVPWATATKAGNEDDEHAEKSDMYRTYASQPPEKAFKWADVRCAVEFKATKRKLGGVPTRYEVKDYVKPTKPFLSISVLKELDDADLALKSVAEAFVDEVEMAAEAPDPSSNTQDGTLKGKGKAPANAPVPSGRVLRARLDRERPSDDALVSQLDNKRAKPSPPESDPDRPPAVVQGGLYAAELFATHLGRPHVISLIILDDVVYVWRFDRQGTFQCSGVNFVQDLPRFLVLLLAMQRFGDKEWGLSQLFRVKRSKEDRWCTIRVDDHHTPVELRIRLPRHHKAFHYGLKGRSTNVLPVTLRALSGEHGDLPNSADYPRHNMAGELVIKLFWPENSRESEEDILKKVYEIAKDDPDVAGHVPEFIWAHKFKETSTATIRVALNMADPFRGARTFCGIVFRRLLPITDLSDKVFLRTWWQTAMCHYKLWRGGVHHRDISANNLMYYLKDNVPVGVVNDFDLASTKQGPTGNERTGTVPFMAIELLEHEGRAGHITHRYQHDAESLGWVLLWISLRYYNGALIDRNRPLDEWLQVDATRCHEKKCGFMMSASSRAAYKCSPSHEESWQIAQQFLFQMFGLHFHGSPVKPDEEIFSQYLLKNVEPYLH
ncbi:hypothetical protein BV22DRAFT_1070026 [Leucogyrophana mollusca]|uniref:Uncharacterized protein n=1 Tax=Leucogyrophana mollusca TaxID=85980 RepID=A0ACB8BBP2_9AGAM|nr:hypothetical protein BV22DRAFT_1070026 [Leucogyrophana mollusca]